ncbi:hypothetical protein ACHAWF_005630 [Thalassiosira exigua]
MEVDLGNVTMVGSGAFMYCTSLTHILMPSTLTKIGVCAFDGCKMLENVELPEGLKEIENSAFACTQLRHINFPSSLLFISTTAFEKCPLKEVIFPERLEVIGPWAFQHCTMLEKVTIRSNNTLLVIGPWAFQHCTSLERVTIRSNNTFLVSRRAFHNCPSLRHVQLSEGTHSFDGTAFSDCPSLSSIRVPPNAFFIEHGDALSNCSSRFLNDSTLNIPQGEGISDVPLFRVVSGKLGKMNGQRLGEIQEKINAIIRNREQSFKQRELRHAIARFRMLDATTTLALAIRKSDLCEETRDVETVIISNVHSFLKVGDKWGFL